jgi:hypothetical protein
MVFDRMRRCLLDFGAFQVLTAVLETRQKGKKDEKSVFVSLFFLLVVAVVVGKRVGIVPGEGGGG